MHSENGFTVDEFCKFINQKANYRFLDANLTHEDGSDDLSLTNLLTNQSFNSILGSDSYNMSKYVEKICLDLPMKLVKHEADQIKLNLIKYFYPILLIFGIIGNLISFCVMIRIYKRGKNFQKFALSLAALSLADLGILLFGCSIEYIEDFLGFQIRSSHEYICKLSVFICYLFSSFSAFLHAYIAAERWLAVSNPFKSKSTCTFRLNQILIIIIFMICLLFNMPLLWFSTLIEKIVLDKHSALGVQIIKECEVSEISFEFHIILTLIDSLFYCLIPFVVTSVFSCLTLVQLTRIKSIDENTSEANLQNIKFKRRANASLKSMTKTESSSSSINHNKTIVYSSIKRHPITHYSHKEGGFQMCKSNQRATSSNLKNTIMLMSIPISYLITSFPIAVIIIQGWIIKLSDTENLNQYFTIAFTVGKILMYVNTSTNIFCYILFGKSLRKDFIGILPCRLVTKRRRLRLQLELQQQHQTNSLERSIRSYRTSNIYYN